MDELSDNCSPTPTHTRRHEVVRCLEVVNFHFPNFTAPIVQSDPAVLSEEEDVLGRRTLNCRDTLSCQTEKRRDVS